MLFCGFMPYFQSDMITISLDISQYINKDSNIYTYILFAEINTRPIYVSNGTTS